ncbi:MAG TPA: response regulator [Bordetella sp.]|jgi:CheY-like chemotaxis protein|nr:response regulator [Bordetella sp.]
MAKIMVVDDEAALARVVREILSGAGHTVYVENDGLTALTRMLEIQPDLVVSDVMMPGMGGASLLTAMRDNAYLEQVPVIVMSGLPEESVIDTCPRYSAFISKPFDLSVIVDTVDRVLRTAA